MRFDVVTIFPEMFRAVTEFGVTGRAISRGVARVECWDPRVYAVDRHRTVDDRPYGGGPGMVMQAPPLAAAVRDIRDHGNQAPVVYLSPQGAPVTNAVVEDLLQQPGIIVVAGRYEGVDERFLERCVDRELSIGDYVLSGGELAAMVLIDAVVRRLPGVLGNEHSAVQDSFVNGVLDCPHYTRPEEFDGLRVPEVLVSGNHAQIRRWREKQSLGRTWVRRPELLERSILSDEQKVLLDEFMSEYDPENDDDEFNPGT